MSHPAEHVGRYTWLTGEASDLVVAGCVTVAVGGGPAAVANAFGLDLSKPVASDDPERWAGHRFASISTPVGVKQSSIVVEDNGFEGAREVVLRGASRGGKAASIFWNVNGLVIFSCARKGRVLYSGEVGLEEELDGLPRQLTRYARLAEDDSTDPVAVGAAMVEAFTGVAFGPEVLSSPWCRVMPVIEQPEEISAESMGLRWEHPDLVATLATMPTEWRRPLVLHVAELAVRQAGVLEHPAVAAVLGSVEPMSAGVVTPSLEASLRRWQVESETLRMQQDVARDGRAAEPLRWEVDRVRRKLVAGHVLQYACHPDDLTAVLGVADQAMSLWRLDGLEQVFAEYLRGRAASAPSTWPAIPDALPPAPTGADRDRQRQAEVDERARVELAAEQAAEAMEWGGRLPTQRLRRAGFAAQQLSSQDPAMAHALAELPDDRLRELANWTASYVLEQVGLLRRPWMAHVAAVLDGELDPSPGQDPGDLRALFEQMDADPGVAWSTFVLDGQPASQQHFALPVASAPWVPDPLAAACGAVDHGSLALGERARLLLAELATRFDVRPM